VAGPDFDYIWVPRIGEQATAELRRYGNLTIVTLFPMLPLAIGISFAFGSGSPAGIVLGFVMVALAVTGFVVWNRSSRRVAAAMSEWFGVKIPWWDMPKMKATSFDAWTEKRKLVPSRPAG